MEFVDHDLVHVWKSPTGGRSLNELIVVLYRGDGVDVLSRTASSTEIRLGAREGWVRGNLRTTASGVLELAFIDVGQGDACLLTTPDRKRVLVDGGEVKLAARYIATRYWNETVAGNDVNFDAIVVTHGDADHFDGLSVLVLDAADEKRDRKRIRITATRVFHNGLVKRGSSVPERERLGNPVAVGGRLLVPLVDDPREVKDANRVFKRWQAALDALAARAPVTISRLDDTSSGSFDFLGEVKVSVLGPRAERLMPPNDLRPWRTPPTMPPPARDVPEAEHDVDDLLGGIDPEARRIHDTLERVGWNVTRAAKELGMNRGALIRLMTKLKIVRP